MPLFFQDAGNGADGAGIIAALLVNLIPLAIGIAMLAGQWKLFVKAGKPGWAVQLSRFITIRC